MNATVKASIQSFYAAHQADVDSLASYLGVPGIWLVCLFYNESALNPSAKNATTGAVGLNQMMPATLAGLGSSPDLYQTGGVAYQLNLMKRYFAPIAGRIKRAGDLYLYDFWPAAIIENYSADFPIGKKDDDSLLKGIKRSTIYNQNKSLDFNNDGVITRQDFWTGFENKYDELVTGSFFFRDLWIDIKTNWFAWVIILLMCLVTVFMIYKNFA